MYAFLIEARTSVDYRELYEAMVRGVAPSLVSTATDSSGTWCIFPSALSAETETALIAADAAYVDPTGGDYILSTKPSEVLYSSVFTDWMTKKATAMGITYSGWIRVEGDVRLVFSRSLTPSEVAQLEAHQDLFFYAEIERDIKFGRDLMIEFTNENVGLGISQAGKTKAVRQAMAEVTSALTVGALLDAIDEARLIPAEDKDATFITDARLLAFINKVEAHYGMPLSEEL